MTAVRLAAALLLAMTASQGETLTVAPGGQLSTLESARDRVRALKRTGARGPFRVEIRAGTYYLAAPLVLTAEDSGITYQSAAGEHVVVSGGRIVRNWTRGKGDTWTAPVEPGWAPRQLFIGSRRTQRARYPNSGFLRIPGPSSEAKYFELPYPHDAIRKSWENAQVEVVALLGWTAFRRPIAQVDEARHIATLAGDSGGSEVGVIKEADGRFFIENAPEALDAPGEWYLHRDRNSIEYWPQGGENLATEELVAARLPQLVRLEGVRDVTFRGIHFRHADWTLPPNGYADAPQAAVRIGAAFEATGAEGCAVEQCTFSQIGGYAVWFGRGSKRNRIVHNEIHDAGAGGIKIGDTLLHENPSERAFENVLTDNVIHDLGKVYPEAVGIWVGHSSRNEIAHNLIHDVSYSGISVGWVWGYARSQAEDNRIEFNEIYAIGRGMLSDLGGIYTLGTRGGTVRNNLVHDVTCFSERARGIYLDEGTTGLRVENNIVYRCTSSGIHLHYGRDNIIRNNISAFNEDLHISRAKAEPHRSLTIENNIVYAQSGRILGGPMRKDEVTLGRNLYFDTRGVAWQPPAIDRGSLVADPLFVDPQRFDFRLRPESPAFQLGFQPIDLSTVGPRPLPKR